MVSPEFGQLWRTRLDHHVEVLTAIVEATDQTPRPPPRGPVHAFRCP